MILENIDIDKAILQNIDIDKISNRFKFGISNRASRQADSAGKCPIKLVPEQPRGGGDVGARVFEGGLRWTFQG